MESVKSVVPVSDAVSDGSDVLSVAWFVIGNVAVTTVLSVTVSVDVFVRVRPKSDVSVSDFAYVFVLDGPG